MNGMDFNERNVVQWNVIKWNEFPVARYQTTTDAEHQEPQDRAPEPRGGGGQHGGRRR